MQLSLVGQVELLSSLTRANHLIDVRKLRLAHVQSSADLLKHLFDLRLLLGCHLLDYLGIGGPILALISLTPADQGLRDVSLLGLVRDLACAVDKPQEVVLVHHAVLLRLTEAFDHVTEAFLLKLVEHVLAADPRACRDA